jgi:hypothetical protein
MRHQVRTYNLRIQTVINTPILRSSILTETTLTLNFINSLRIMLESSEK